MARYLHDGTIVFVGRTDQQVKIRGFRVELGEIEAALRRHPAVRDSVVLAREDVSPASGYPDPRLVAYVVPATNDGRRTTKDDRRPTIDDGSPSEQSSIVHRLSSSSEDSDSSFVIRPSSFVQELRSHLRQTLPDYMLPSALMILDAIPLSPNGKVDHRALPAPSAARPELAESFVAPRTAIEEQLAGIWTAVLGIERVGIHDNFFELGGHSLLAIQVISRVRSAFHADLALRTLFEAPTIAGLAAALSQSPADDAELDDDIPLLARGDQSLEQLLAELEQLPEP